MRFHARKELETSFWLAEQECYSDALQLAPEVCPSRAVYYANRAACELKLEQYSEAAQDCTAALKLDSQYLKALLRRSDAYEHMDDLDGAFEDAKKVGEMPQSVGAL